MLFQETTKQPVTRRIQLANRLILSNSRCLNMIWKYNLLWQIYSNNEGCYRVSNNAFELFITRRIELSIQLVCNSSCWRDLLYSTRRSRHVKFAINVKSWLCYTIWELLNKTQPPIWSAKTRCFAQLLSLWILKILTRTMWLLSECKIWEKGWKVVVLGGFGAIGGPFPNDIKFLKIIWT
jgi:hypothetical protein